MIKLRNLTQRYPIVFAVVLTVAVEAICRFFNFFIAFIPDLYVANIVSKFVHMLWPVALTLVLGYGFVLKEKGFGKTLKVGLGFVGFYTFVVLAAVYAALDKPDVVWQTWDRILLGFVTLFGIGLREDLLFRGVIGSAMGLKYAKTSKGIWLTLAVSSVTFGLLHFFNISYGVSFGAACVQVLGATAIGAVFGAIYLRGGNIWVPILIHAVVDFAGLFESTFIANAATDVDKINQLSATGLLISIPVEILLVVFLLRKSKHAEILERMETLRGKYGIAE